MLPVPFLLDSVTQQNYIHVDYGCQAHELIVVNRDIMGEAIKRLNIGTKVLARRDRAMWDILLASEDAANLLAWSTLTTKLLRRQTEYLGSRKTKVILHGMPLYISLNHLGLVVTKFAEVASVSAIKNKAGIATEDVELMVTVSRKKLLWRYRMC